jgi:hypothetical protein
MTALAVGVSAPPTGNLPCTGNQYVFYGKHAERPETRVRREGQAKMVCRTCPQAETCRDYARSNNEVFGVWGGETEIERYNAGFLEFVPHHLSRNSAIVKRDEHL